MDRPKVGDAVEFAMWLTSEESAEQIARWVELDCPSAMAELAVGMMLGPVSFEVKYPGEDRVPPVPDHISGPDVRMLVGEAKIVGEKPVLTTKSFLLDLDPRDLERLRAITRRVRRQYGPPLSDSECDSIIEQIGPAAAIAAVREAVDGCLVH